MLSERMLLLLGENAEGIVPVTKGSRQKRTGLQTVGMSFCVLLILAGV